MVTTRSQSSVTKQEPTSTPQSTPDNPATKKRKRPERVSNHFTSQHTSDRPTTIPQPEDLPFQLQPAGYGLIQERIRDSLYALVVQVILWNQTHGRAARPVLFQILALYPTPFHLSQADLDRLTAILQPLGLHNVRAKRLIALAEAWLAAPPCKERRYRRLHYPNRGCGLDVKTDEILGLEDEREGWEIAHLPGMGPYALDSFRIFYRDRLREITEGESEWKRVVPLDKDLRPYLKWRWAQDGWKWHEFTGTRSRLTSEEMERVKAKALERSIEDARPKDDQAVKQEDSFKDDALDVKEEDLVNGHTEETQ
ncbi:DNA glycosylase [Didymella exigua CBS 183.55]|uniref:DNA glycosylase n=1 Tax=Didymella exigua CBS 183.55 TaxID=1150837 RepID=A0A6A5R9X8_9PLEO|nr:DNA glycosylase [Didymella exigua CBS 183.55]KAF1924323.1 DNA glycosylase [Didymella exigua CBS 183.55]